MKKKMWIILLSVLFLGVYLTGGKILDRFSEDIMKAKVLSMEEINLLCEGKEDAFMESEITLNGGKIAYDSEQNLLLVPQNLSEEQFEGSLQVPDGKLYFLEDEALGDKAQTIRESKMLHLFWIRDTRCWMYNVYFTGMPVASIDTKEVSEEEISSGEIWVYDPYHSAAEYQKAECTWHLRGATSLNYEKSSYRLTLTDKKLSLLGMRKDDDWMLHSLYDDEGLIHNKLSYEVWQEIAASNDVNHDEGISMEYVELFLDDTYLGVYGLSERIDKKALHLNDKDILYKCKDQKDPGLDDFYSELTEEMTPTFVWKHPKDFEMEDWEPLRKWVSMFCFEEFEDYESAAAILNMENAVDYNLFNMLTCGMDNIMKNIYFHADYQEDGSYRFIKIPWDLNMTWGNSWIDDGNCNFNRFQEKNFDGDDGWTPDMYLLYEHVPEKTGPLLADRWQELRVNIITKEALYEKLDSEFAYLYDSGAYIRNRQKWPPKGEYWQDEYIYEYVDRRIDFLDGYFEQMRRQGG
ncbi:MAG: hypothetical protein HFJ01_01135 [Lachnospiraceae bacterium]|nr:CotH kinase family protein [Parablautia intestinalis]MCI8613710.1 hypothetical protein [Lachnospiraceae bacterium]